MQTLLQSFIIQLCVIGVASYALTFLTRHVFEAGFQSLKVTSDPKKPYATTMARWWNEVILYALPVGYGIGACLLLRMTTFFPAEFKSVPAAIILGTALGFMSGFLYKVLKRILIKEAGVEKEEDLPSADAPELPK